MTLQRKPGCSRVQAEPASSPQPPAALTGGRGGGTWNTGTATTTLCVPVTLKRHFANSLKVSSSGAWTHVSTPPAQAEEEGGGRGKGG